MNAPRLDNTWTVGNLLTLATLIVGGTLAFAATQSDLRAVASDVNYLSATVSSQQATVEARLAQVERLATEREARIRALELVNSRDDERFANILTAIQDLRDAVRALDPPRSTVETRP